MFIGFGTIVVIVIIALVAFGSSSNNSVDPLAKAATLSGNAPGFKMTMTMKVGTASEPDLLTGNGSGVFDTRGHSGAMGLSMKIRTAWVELGFMLTGPLVSKLQNT